LHFQNLEEELPELELPQLDDLWARIREADEVEDQTELADFIDADQALATTGTRTLEEIAASTSSTIQAEPESEDDEPELQRPPPVSRQQAYQGFDQLRRYIEENVADPKAIQFCHYMEDLLHQEQAKNSVQAPITQFFK
jgi:hypothetical protein